MYIAKEKIESNKEFDVLLEFTKTRWQGIDVNVENLMHAVFTAGLEKSQYWIKRHDMQDKIDFLLEDRKKNIYLHHQQKMIELNEDQLDDIMYIDCLANFLKSIDYGVINYDKIVKKDFQFEKELKKICSDLSVGISLKGIHMIKPIGWDDWIDNHVDMEGFETYDFQKDKNDFKGCDSSGVLSYSFPEKISLPHVIYNEMSQNLKKIESLMGAFFSHGLFLGNHLNQLQVSDDLQIIYENNQRNFSYHEIKTDSNVLNAIAASHTLTALIQSKEQFKNAYLDVLQTKIHLDKQVTLQEQENDIEDILNELNQSKKEDDLLSEKILKILSSKTIKKGIKCK